MREIQKRSLWACRLAVGLLVVCLAVAAALRSQQQAVGAEPEAVRRAVVLLRLINNSEASYREAFQAYATWQELSESRIPETLAAQIDEQRRAWGREPLAFNVGSLQPLTGYSLSLYTSPDRAHYISSLRPIATTDECAPSFYSSDDGPIQLAKTIGCK